MRKKIFKNMCLLALVTILLSSLLVTIVYYANSDARMKSEVREETRFVRGAVELSGQDYLATVENTANRITLIDTDGTVLYDNQADPATMENHSDREEFQEASTAGAGEATRISDTIAEQTFYYAVKLQNGQVLRVAATTDSVFAAVLAVLPWILGVEVLVAVCTVLFSNFLTKKIVAPINRLDLDHPADNEIYDELSPLLGKISRQNEVIAQQIKSLREKQEEFTSITENMSEGFLVLDNNTDILSYNTSALRLLGAEAVPAESHVSALALNRSAGFRSAVDGALAGKRSEQLVRQGGRCCQVMANPVLRDGEVEGAVVVILDITEREERENLRREFTANVSHELKTPLTSISGFAEIIKNGIVKPEDIPRFAGNIYEESQRLVTLVDDILNLSRLDEADVQLEREDFPGPGCGRPPEGLRQEKRRGHHGDWRQGGNQRREKHCGRDGLQPGGQRREVQQAERPGHRHRGQLLRRHRPDGDRHRHRHPPGGCGPGVRALLPGGQEPLQGDWRHGPGALHRQAWGGLPQRQGQPAEHRRRRHHRAPGIPQLITSSSLKIFPRKGKGLPAGRLFPFAFAGSIQEQAEGVALCIEEHDDPLVL